MISKIMYTQYVYNKHNRLRVRFHFCAISLAALALGGCQREAVRVRVCGSSCENSEKEQLDEVGLCWAMLQFSPDGEPNHPSPRKGISDFLALTVGLTCFG